MSTSTESTFCSPNQAISLARTEELFYHSPQRQDHRTSILPGTSRWDSDSTVK